MEEHAIDSTAAITTTPPAASTVTAATAPAVIPTATGHSVGRFLAASSTVIRTPFKIIPVHPIDRMLGRHRLASQQIQNPWTGPNPDP